MKTDLINSVYDGGVSYMAHEGNEDGLKNWLNQRTVDFPGTPEEKDAAVTQAVDEVMKSAQASDAADAAELKKHLDDVAGKSKSFDKLKKGDRTVILDDSGEPVEFQVTGRRGDRVIGHTVMNEDLGQNTSNEQYYEDGIMRSDLDPRVPGAADSAASTPAGDVDGNAARNALDVADGELEGAGSTDDVEYWDTYADIVGDEYEGATGIQLTDDQLNDIVSEEIGPREAYAGGDPELQSSDSLVAFDLDDPGDMIVKFPGASGTTRVRQTPDDDGSYSQVRVELLEDAGSYKAGTTRLVKLNQIQEGDVRHGPAGADGSVDDENVRMIGCEAGGEGVLEGLHLPRECSIARGPHDGGLCVLRLVPPPGRVVRTLDRPGHLRYISTVFD